MKYELYFHPTALKEWKKLATELQDQFRNIIKRRLENPHVPLALLKGPLKNCYKIKLRQAGYRLVYEVNDQKLIIIIIAVGKRNQNDVYQKAEMRRV